MDNLSAARILKILMDHRVEGVKQEDLVKYLFQTYSYSDEGQEFIFDKGRISKWVNGVEKISPSIRDFYTGECEVDLSLDLEEEVFMYIDSPEDVTADIVKCIQDDVLMKPKTKAELLEFLKEENEQRYSNFVAHTLVYAMKMQSVRKRNDSSVMNATDRTGMQRGAYLYDGEPPEPCRYFVGRKRELEELHQRLLASGKVFVSGLPGNGKSEFAKKYTLQYRDKYREVVYIDYSGDLYSDIANLDYSTDMELSTQESRFKEHNRSLKKMTQDSLLIIDNFDTTVMNEKIFSVIMKYKCKVLITTRNVFYGQEQMRLKAMEEEDLFELSCKLFSEAGLWKEDLLEIYKLIHHHTFVTELISRLLATGILDPDELFEQLRKNRLHLILKIISRRAKMDVMSRRHIDNIFESYFG